MKKIKGILLFGILTLFGIGSSFAIDGNVFMSIQDNVGFANFSTWIYQGTNSSNRYLRLTRSDSTSRNTYYYSRSSVFTTWSKIYLNYTDNIFDGNICFFCNIPNPNTSTYLFFGDYVGNVDNRVLNSGDDFNFTYLVNNSVYSGTALNTGSINYYLYFNEKKIQSNYGTFTDIGNGLVRKKIISNGGGISSISIYDGFSVPYSSGYKQFSFIPSDGYIIDDYGNGVYNLNVNVYSGFLLTHFQSYNTSGYISQNNTILISFDSSNIYYNIYTGVFNKYSQLTSNSPIYRGILYSNGSNGYNDFMTFIYDSGSFVEVLGSYGDGIIFKSFAKEGNNRITTDYTFTFNENSSVPDILNPDGQTSYNLYSGVITSSTCIDTQVCYDTTGDNGEVLHICTSKCIDTGSIVSGSYVGSDGTIYYVDSSYNVGNISNPDGTIYDTGFLDEDGLLSIDYYSGLFNGNGFRFGVCPYPASDYLNFATKIKLGNFYPFMPLNCFISAFQQGVKVHYFDDSGLFPDNHSQLMAGDSHYHKTIFRFFDVLLSIGLLLLLSALLRIIKK